MKQKRNKKIPAIAALSTLAFATLTAPVFAQTTLNLSGKAKVNNVQINSDAKITAKDEAKITGDVTIKAGATPDLTDINLSPGKEIKVAAPVVTLNTKLDDIVKGHVKLNTEIGFNKLQYQIDSEDIDSWKPVPITKEIAVEEGANAIFVRVKGTDKLPPSISVKLEVKDKIGNKDVLKAAQEAVAALFGKDTEGNVDKTKLAAGVTQETIDVAKAKVNAVADATAKEELQVDINAAQTLLDEQTAGDKLKAAQEAVAALFKDETKAELAAGVTQETIAAAQEKVNAVADATAKEELQADINAAKNLLDKQTLSSNTEIAAKAESTKVTSIDTNTHVVTVASATTVADVIAELESNHGAKIEVQKYNKVEDKWETVDKTSNEDLQPTKEPATNGNHHILVTAQDGKTTQQYKITVQ